MPGTEAQVPEVLSVVGVLGCTRGSCGQKPIEPGIRAGSLQNFISNARGDALRRVMDRVAGQVGVARCRLDIVVSEQLADHRQGFAKRERPGTQRCV